MYIDFESLGKRIAQRRMALGYKQNELAEMADLSNNYLSNIENGHSIPSLTTFANLCLKLETTPDMFLLGTIKTNDIPQSIIDNLKLCNDKSLSLISDICFLTLTLMIYIFRISLKCRFHIALRPENFHCISFSYV